MAKQITRVVKITAWKKREEWPVLGDISWMVAEPSFETVIEGRRANVSAWFEEATGNGYEQIIITLHDWEV